VELATSPYPGPRPFARADGGSFFGREGDVSAIAALVSEYPLVTVHGPPGSGKTSVVVAAVLPLFEQEGYTVLGPGRVIGTSTRTTDPAEAILSRHFIASLDLDDSFKSLRDLADGLPEAGRGGYLLVIDQFEEAYHVSLPDPLAARDSFFGELAHTLKVRSDVRVLLIVGDNELGHMLDDLERSWSDEIGRHRVGPLSPGAAVKAIREPAAVVGTAFEDGAAERLVDDLRTRHVAGADGTQTSFLSDGVEPLALQVVASRLWDSLPSGTTVVTTEDIAGLGMPSSVVSEWLGGAIADVAVRTGSDERSIREALDSNFVTSEGARLLITEDAAGMPSAVLEGLAESKVLLVKTRGGVRYYELAHDDFKTRPPGTVGDRVEPSPDTPTSVDRLRRRLVASAIGDLLTAVRRRLEEEESAKMERAFGILLDGPWGSGKSTVLRLLTTEPSLRDQTTDSTPWQVIHYDAWRESQVGPAWWSLYTTLERDITTELSWRARFARWVQSRGRFIGGPLLSAAGVLAAAVLVGIVVLAFIGFEKLTLEGTNRIVGLASTTLAVAASVWVIAVGVTKALSFSSSQRAQKHETSSSDPTRKLLDQFDLLLEYSPNTPLLMIDDLDRCDEEYVVELLDAIQTLMRSQHPNKEEAAKRQPLFFIVAADGRWIRTAYEHAHSRFAPIIGEGGKPLGYLFTEKIFQVVVPIPELSDEQRATFLRYRLLGDVTDAEDPPLDLTADDRAVLGTAQDLVTAAGTRDEIIEAGAKLDPAMRELLVRSAVERLRSPGLSEVTEHRLEEYHSMLPPNPREITRFVMAFSVTSTVRIAENTWIPTDPLARWIVAQTRWPALTDHLQTHPEAVEDGRLLPDELRQLPDLAAAANVLSEFDADLVRECAGSPPTNT